MTKQPEYHIQAIFPTPLFSTGLPRSLSAGEIHSANDLLSRSQPNQGNHFTPNMQALEDARLSLIKDFINSSCAEYVSRIYQPSRKLELVVTQSWLNRTKPGQYHHQHTHPNSVVSGVFYFQTHDQQDTIKFEKSYSQWLVESHSQNPFNIENLLVLIKPGQLLLFPSSLIHSVPVNNGQKDRISLSFNTMWSGQVSQGQGCALTI